MKLAQDNVWPAAEYGRLRSEGACPLNQALAGGWPVHPGYTVSDPMVPATPTPASGSPDERVCRLVIAASFMILAHA